MSEELEQRCHSRFLFGEDRRDAPQLDLVGDAQGRVCLFEPATSETGTTGSWIEVDEEVLVPLEADDG